jgi:hypothetical protein
MSSTILHPVLLTALEPERRASRTGQLAGLVGLLLGVVLLSLAIG